MAYQTRYRGQHVPSTVELEVKNSLCLGEEDMSEAERRASKSSRRAAALATAARRKRKQAEEESDEEYDGAEDEANNWDSDSDVEVATAKALVMQGRGPGPPAGFRWASPSASSTASATTSGGHALQPSPRLSVLEPPDLADAAQQATGGAAGDKPLAYHNVHERRRQFYPVNVGPPPPPPHPLFHAVKHIPAMPVSLGVGVDEEKRNTWTADEDKILASLVAKYGPKKWGIIASYLPLRNAKQCHQRCVCVREGGRERESARERECVCVRARGRSNGTLAVAHFTPPVQTHLPNPPTWPRSWHYVLKPSISRDSWTEREDYIIYHYHGILGNKWSQIAKYLDGRCVCGAGLCMICPPPSGPLGRGAMPMGLHLTHLWATRLVHCIAAPATPCATATPSSSRTTRAARCPSPPSRPTSPTPRRPR